MPTSTFCLGIEHHLEYVFPSYILVTTLTYIIYKPLCRAIMTTYEHTNVFARIKKFFPNNFSIIGR